jgi:hypothetical protein
MALEVQRMNDSFGWSRKTRHFVFRLALVGEGEFQQLEV